MRLLAIALLVAIPIVARAEDGSKRASPPHSGEQIRILCDSAVPDDCFQLLHRVIERQRLQRNEDGRCAAWPEQERLSCYADKAGRNKR